MSAAVVTGADYALTPFNSQGATQGSLVGVNNQGHAAGSEYGVLSGGQGYSSYLWTTANDATPVIACCGLPGAINRSDVVVGWGGPFPQTLPFVWTPGNGIAYPPLLAGHSTGRALGINDAGAVVGVSTASDFDHGRAVLWVPTGEGPGAFAAIDLGALPGDQYSVAQAINVMGQVVGYSSNSAGESHAILWQPTSADASGYSIVALGTLGGATSEAWAINDAGQVVGRSATSAAVQDAFAWTPDETGRRGNMVDLGAGLARGISDNGVVVGNDGNGVSAWVWTPTTGRTSLPALNATVVGVQGINSRGTAIAGFYRSTSAGTQYPVLWNYMTRPPACVPSPDGLVSWWRGNGDATDAIGGNNGTLGGGVTFAAGVVGQAFHFDGQTGDVLIGTKPSLNVGAGDGLTFEAWAKADGNTAYEPGAGPILEYVNGLHLWEHDGPFPSHSGFLANFNTWIINGETPTPGALLNEWHHLAFTYSMLTGQGKLYLDGLLVATRSGPTHADDPTFGNTTTDLHIGRRIAGSYGSVDDVFNGSIDEPAIYDRVLDASEILALYNAGSAGKCDPVNHPPVADAGKTVSGLEGAPVAFDGSKSADPDGDSVTYDWDFGDHTRGTGANPAHAYADNGTYSVTLTVTDSKGATSALATTTAVVANVDPAGTLSTDPTVVEGGPITLSVVEAIDAPGDIGSLRFAFDCGDGTGYTAATYAAAAASAVRLCATVDGPATRVVRAKIFDKDGGFVESAPTTVSIKNATPVVVLSGSSPTLRTSQTLTVTGSFSDQGAIDGPWKWLIDWRDGTPPTTGMVTSQGTSITAIHAYRVEGSFTPSLLVVDKDGATGVGATAVTVSASPNAIWTTMASGTTADLASVWGASQKEVFAVGGDATGPRALHFDGNVWTDLPLPAAYSGYQLVSVHGNAPRNVYAIAVSGGTSAKILRYDGSNWSDAPRTTYSVLHAVWVSPTSTVYAVGSAPSAQGTVPFVVHYDGRTWQTIPPPASLVNLTAVWGTSDSDVYVAAQVGTVAHWNGSQWWINTLGPYAFAGLWGSSSKDVYAVGSSSSGALTYYHGTAGSWSLNSLPATTGALAAVWGSSATDVYMVGQTGTSASQSIFHFNGAAWSSMLIPAVPGRLKGIWGSSANNMFVVGDRGTILHGTP